MMSSILSTEIRHFCETTSVKGIPRVVNSRTLIHRVLWFIGVITCGVALIVQLSILLDRYFSHQVNTLYRKAPDYDNATFPDITICNIFPLVNQRPNVISYAAYITLISETFTFENFLNFTSAEYDRSDSAHSRIRYDLASQITYLLNFPIIITNPNNSAHNFPIIDCNYFDWDYEKNVNFSDSNCVASVTQIWDPDYHTCYTLKLPNSERKNIRGLAAIVYVEDYEGSLLKSYPLQLIRKLAAGMQVLVHATGTKPNMKLGMSIGPGLLTTIAVDQTKVSHLPYPYSNCTTQENLKLSVKDTTTYTKPLCVDLCIQEQYLEKCKCIKSTLQFTILQLEGARFHMCGNLSIQNENDSIAWEGINEILCVNTFVPDQSRCQQKCFTQCEELQYSTSINSAPWPHVSAQLSVYGAYINYTTRDHNKFKEYELAYQYAYENISASQDILEELDRQGTLKKKLLQLNVQMNTPAYNELKDTVGFTADALGAQVGGTLAVWLGITIIVLFEVIEFFVNLLYAGYQYKYNGHIHTVEFEDTKL